MVFNASMKKPSMVTGDGSTQNPLLRSSSHVESADSNILTTASVRARSPSPGHAKTPNILFKESQVGVASSTQTQITRKKFKYTNVKGGRAMPVMRDGSFSEDDYDDDDDDDDDSENKRSPLSSFKKDSRFFARYVNNRDQSNTRTSPRIVANGNRKVFRIQDVPSKIDEV